jgi:hypothetical protein
MNERVLLETILLGINAYQAYRACVKGWRCGVAVAIFMLNAVVYVASRIQVDEPVVSLAVPIAVLVALLVVAE